MLKKILGTIGTRYMIALLNLLLIFVNARVLGVEGVGLAGIIALKQNDLRTARDRFEHAVKRSPKDARLHTNLAIVYDGMRKKKAALRELRKAVALDPNLAEARFNLAILLVSEKPPKLTEAKHHYQTALQLGSTRDERLEKILYQ